MKNGHRRTSSENYCFGISKQAKINLGIRQTNSKIPSLLKKSNRVNKTKTVKIECIDVQQETPRPNCMFFFGRKQYQTPTGTSSRYEEDILKSIPEAVSKKSTVKRKAFKKQIRDFEKTLDMNLKSSTISPFSNSNIKSSSLLASPSKKIIEKNKSKCQPYFKNIKSKPNEQKQKLQKPVQKKQSNSCQNKL